MSKIVKEILHFQNQNLLLTMLSISINKAEFFAYHGFYPEEQVLGSKFCVDITVKFNPPGKIDDVLSKTVNYEQLYQIVSDEMNLTRQLIETVAEAIAGKIISKYPYLKEVSVCLKKLNPPFKGKTDYTSAEIFYQL